MRGLLGNWQSYHDGGSVRDAEPGGQAFSETCERAMQLATVA